MKYIELNKNLCNVKFLLNIIDLKSECAAELAKETQSADFFQIYFIKKAKGYLNLNDKKINLSPNTLIFISQHQKYSWHIKSKEYEGYLLIFQDQFLNDFFSDQYFIFRLLYFYQTQHPLSLNINQDIFYEYIDKLMEIRKEIVSPQSDSVHLIRSILYYLLITLNRYYSKQFKLGEIVSTDNTAYQFRKLVEQKLYSNQRVDDYSKMMNLSRISINKAVKSQFNVTASDFIKSRLLFEIKMKLIHSSKTISEIAYELNFTEINHLSRFFRKKVGMSPIEYRFNYQNDQSL